MASFNTPSSSNNDSGFIRKPLSPAALAAAAIISAANPQLAAQAGENYSDGVQTITAQTKQKTMELGLSQNELDSINGKGNGSFSYSPMDSVNGDGTSRLPNGTIYNPKTNTLTQNTTPINPDEFFSKQSTQNASANPGAMLQGLSNQQLKTLFGGLSGIEYSKEYGVIVNVGIQKNPDETSSLIFLGRLGKNERGALAAYGIEIGKDMQLSFFGEHLSQKRTFQTEDYWASQNKTGVNFRFAPQTGPAKSIEAKTSYTQSNDTNLASNFVIVDGATLYEKFIVDHRFVGSRAIEATLGATFDVGQKSEVTVTGGLVNTKSNDGLKQESRFSGGVKYLYYTGEGKLQVEARKTGAENTFTTGYETTLGDSGVVIMPTLQHTTSANGYSDTRGMLNIGAEFMADFTLAKKGAQTNKYDRPDRKNLTPIATNLAADIGQFKSHTVIGEVKEVNRTRQIAIDKTGLPTGVSIDVQTGNIIIDGLTPATAVAAALKNGSATSLTPFSIVGGKLIINTAGLTQPAVGVTDTYVLTTNSTPADTVTITVEHGSIMVTNVVVLKGVFDTLPDAFTFVDQTGIALSTLTESAGITVAGINAASAISVVGGEYQINGGAWVSVLGTVTSGQTVKVRHTSSGSNSTAVNTTLTIGGVSDVFTTTTLAPALDTTLPATPTLAIAAGAALTNSLTPAITIANDTDNIGVTGWYVAETSSTTPANGAWSASKPTSVTIGAGDGIKTVKVWTKDAAGNVSLAGSDTITLDQTAPSYASESFPTLDTAGQIGSGTMSFDEAVHSVSSISFKKTIDNSPAGGSISVASGLDSTTLGINFTAPNLITEDVYIELTVVDTAGNTRTVRTVNNYFLF